MQTDFNFEIDFKPTNYQKFVEWHGRHPDVYNLFKRFTFEAIESGHQKLSAWFIINRIRWETSVVTDAGDFKISNDKIGYYSRKFMKDYPEYEGFFRTRPLKDEPTEVAPKKTTGVDVYA